MRYQTRRFNIWVDGSLLLQFQCLRLGVLKALSQGHAWLDSCRIGATYNSAVSYGHLSREHAGVSCVCFVIDLVALHIGCAYGVYGML